MTEPDQTKQSGSLIRKLYRLMTIVALLIALTYLGYIISTPKNQTEVKQVTYGDLDTVNVVPLRNLADSSIEEIKSRYLGKIITFSHITPNKVRARSEKRKNACMMAFMPDSIDDTGSVHLGGTQWKVIDLAVYFNWGDEISDHLNKWTTFNPPWELENPLHVKFDICDPSGACQAFNTGPECPFQENFLITGKVINLDVWNYNELKIDLRPTGLRL